METIKISKRQFQVMTRALKVKWYGFLKEGDRINRHNKNFPDSYFTMWISGDEKVEFVMDHISNEEDEVLYRVSLMEEGKFLFKRIFYKEDNPLEVLKTWGELPCHIKKCQCGAGEEEEGWCETCYIYRIEHPTGKHCAICLENEGRYIQTECGHYFHRHCYLRIIPEMPVFPHLRKCPMCRKETEANLDDILDW